MTRIWLVRHGPTHQSVFTGWRDVPADLRDEAALDRLMQALPAGAPIVSSDLLRAVQTGDRLELGRRRLPHDRDLREFNFGTWEGLSFEEIEERDPELSRAFWDDPGGVTPPGGESWDALEIRVSAAVDRLSAATDDIVVVAHFGAILTQLRRALACSPFEVLSQGIRPLSLTRLDRDGADWKVQMIDHCP